MCLISMDFRRRLLRNKVTCNGDLPLCYVSLDTLVSFIWIINMYFHINVHRVVSLLCFVFRQCRTYLNDGGNVGSVFVFVFMTIHS